MPIAQAKLKVERLAIKYNTTMEEIKTLEEKDDFVSKEITKIEESLGERLKPNMTAEEIVAKIEDQSDSGDEIRSNFFSCSYLGPLLRAGLV